MVGQTISHYKILEKLGEGGMGVVYKAHDLKLNRVVALKFLPRHISAGEAEKARLLQEAQAAAALNHPNICTIHGIEQDGDEQFIVMEYIDGKTLRKNISNIPSSIDDCIGLARQIGEALQDAHSKGVIHRDIKPENIMVTSKNHIKIMDFGLAKLKGNLGLTRTASTVGTLAYMSPEQIQSSTVDHRSDIWSLGVLLYEMLTGRLPFRGEHQAAMVYSITNEEPQPISTDIPQQLQAVLVRTLEKDRDKRYQRIEDLISDLKRPVPSSAFVQPTKSIVVLPFENISPDKETEYFSDGLTEEIITNLSRIGSLKVVSRTSSMHYKGTKKPLREIAKELTVQYALEGSVRKQGHEVRITAQLIDASRDVHLWAEKFPGTMQDVFDIQEKVAQEIAKALKVQLTEAEDEGLRKRYTRNTEAYELYLKGNYYLWLVTPESINKAIEYFELAAAKDPNYAPAYAGLAMCYNGAAWFEYMDPHEAFSKGRALAIKALEIDESLAEAHNSVGYSDINGWNWRQAEQHIRRAIELKPNYADAHLHQAWLLGTQSRFDEAMLEMKRAYELDPLSLIINVNVVFPHYWKRQYEQAITQALNALRLEPSFYLGHWFLGIAYAQSEKYEEAISAFQKAVTFSGGGPYYKGWLGHVYAAGGKRQEAMTILTELEQLSKQKKMFSYQIALVYIGLGENEQAMDWLEKANAERAPFMIYMNIDPYLDPLRSNPRFYALLRGMGLVKDP